MAVTSGHRAADNDEDRGGNLTVSVTQSPATFQARLLSLNAVLILLTLFLILIAIPHTMADPDLWWHLRNAREAIGQRAVVTHDTYSFTVHGVPWMDHEWLSELAFYLSWLTGGANGIYFLSIALIESIFIAVLWLCWRASHSVVTACASTLVAALLATVSFGPRTLLFGWLCLVIQLVVLELFRDCPRAVLALPVLYLFWINLHGSWLIGLALLFLFTLTGLMRLDQSCLQHQSFSPRQTRLLAISGAALVPALLCNPWGWQLVTYPFNFAFKQTLNVASVQEWQSLDLHSMRGRLVLAGILLVAGRQLWKPRTWSLNELAWLLIGLYSAFNYSRFLFLLALLAAPAVSRSFPSRKQFPAAPPRFALNAMLLITLATLTLVTVRRQTCAKDEGLLLYPVAVLRALSHIPPQSRVFNEYSLGGYLEWYAPNTPVFIDSRMDIFEYNNILRDYLDIIHLNRSIELLDHYKIDHVLFAKSTPLIYLLQHTSGWKSSYQNENFILMDRFCNAASKSADNPPRCRDQEGRPR